MCVYVCVREREGERESKVGQRKRQLEKQADTDRSRERKRQIKTDRDSNRDKEIYKDRQRLTDKQRQ